MNVMTCDQCATCQHCTLEEESKARIYVTCDLHEGSRWFFGQYVNCDGNYKKRKDEDGDEECGGY